MLAKNTYKEYGKMFFAVEKMFIWAYFRTLFNQFDILWYNAFQSTWRLCVNLLKNICLFWVPFRFVYRIKEDKKTSSKNWIGTFAVTPAIRIAKRYYERNWPFFYGSLAISITLVATKAFNTGDYLLFKPLACEPNASLMRVCWMNWNCPKLNNSHKIYMQR